MTKADFFPVLPCKSCKHYDSRHGVHYCAEKKRQTSVARITGATGSHQSIDCHEQK